MFYLFSFWDSVGKVFGAFVGIVIISLVYSVLQWVFYPGLRQLQNELKQEGFDNEQSKFLCECFKRKQDFSRIRDKRYTAGQMYWLQVGQMSGIDISELLDPNISVEDMKARIEDMRKR